MWYPFYNILRKILHKPPKFARLFHDLQHIAERLAGRFLQRRRIPGILACHRHAQLHAACRAGKRLRGQLKVLRLDKRIIKRLFLKADDERIAIALPVRRFECKHGKRWVRLLQRCARGIPKRFLVSPRCGRPLCAFCGASSGGAGGASSSDGGIYSASSAGSGASSQGGTSSAARFAGVVAAFGGALCAGTPLFSFCSSCSTRSSRISRLCGSSSGVVMRTNAHSSCTRGSAR